MRDFRDAKAMAQSLREALKAKSVSVTHSEGLELIAKSFGLPDWNVLAAKIQASQPGAIQSGTPIPPAGPVAIPVIPMRDVVFFPHTVTPIFIGREKSRRAADHALERDGLLLAVTQKRAGDDDPGPDALYPVGVTVSVINRTMLPDGNVKLIVSCRERKAIVRFVEDPFLAAEVATVEEQRGDTMEATELSRAVLETYQVYADVDFSRSKGLRDYFHLPSVGNASLLADTIAPFLTVGIERKQQILETTDVVARLEMILELMKAGKQAA